MTWDNFSLWLTGRKYFPMCPANYAPSTDSPQLSSMTYYFGRTDVAPPGLPGGGITGVLPVSGVGARISGSTPAGGQSTPSDLASLSPSGSARWPAEPPGSTVPCGLVRVGTQFVDGRGGVAVGAGGVAVGGACAKAALEQARRAARKIDRFISMVTKRNSGPDVPGQNAAVRTCGSGSAKNDPMVRSDGAR